MDQEVHTYNYIWLSNDIKKSKRLVSYLGPTSKCVESTWKSHLLSNILTYFAFCIWFNYHHFGALPCHVFLSYNLTSFYSRWDFPPCNSSIPFCRIYTQTVFTSPHPVKFKGSLKYVPESTRKLLTDRYSHQLHLATKCFKEVAILLFKVCWSQSSQNSSFSKDWLQNFYVVILFKK